MNTKLIIILFASILAAYATTYYVATDGLNTDPGTIGHPWETISYATSTSSPVGAGDTILVRAGNYPEQIFPEISGNQTSPIVLMNFPDESVTLNPGRIQFNNGADYWKIAGLKFLKSSSNGMRVTGTHPLRFLTISRCRVSSHERNGIELSGPDFGGVTIEDCIIDSNGTASEGNAILMYGGVGVLWAHRNLIIDNEGKGITHATEAAWEADSSVIDSNIIINSLGSGMDWWGDNSYITHNYFSHNGVRDPEPDEWGDKGMALDQNASGNLVAFNIIKSSGGAELEPRGGGNRIYNNILIKDHYYTTVPGSPQSYTIIFWDNGGMGNEFRNNIIINLLSQPYHHFTILAANVGRYTSQIWSNNLYWAPNATSPPPANKSFKLYGFPGSIYATLEEIQTTYPNQEIGSLYDNPHFVSYADSNFHLLPGSPAIDAGTYVGFPYYGDAPDMGAFEFNPAGIFSFEESPNNGLSMQVYPNPFVQMTDIRWQITDNGSLITDNRLHIKIYNVTGRTVKQFSHLTTPPFNQITWNGVDDAGNKLPAGVYFVRLKVDEFAVTEKITKLR